MNSPEYSHSYYTRNREAILAKQKVYDDKRRAAKNAAAKLYRMANKEKIAAHKAQYQVQHKAQVDEKNARLGEAAKMDAFNAYGGPVCACCGETLLEGLSIDHINGDGARHRKETGGGGKGLYWWLRKHNYPSGYQVLCMTCNVAKRKSDRCPHNRVPDVYAPY